MKRDRMIPLFQNAELESFQELRPLGSWSTLATEKIPQLSDTLLRESPQIAKDKLDQLWPKSKIAKVQTLNKAELELAFLDLTLIQSFADRIQCTVPSDLRDSLNEYAEFLGRPDAYLYESCILQNPLTEDPRVFTSGEVGRTERDFLIAHKRIEEHLSVIIPRLLQVIQNGSSLDHFEFKEVLTEIEFHLKEIGTYFSTLQKMRSDHFFDIRKFYLSSPRTYSPGPSGRFSAQLHLVRLLMEGEEVENQVPGYFEELKAISPFFPSGHRVLVQEQMLRINQKRGPHCLRQLTLDSRSPFHAPRRELLSVLRKGFDRITATHYGLAHRHIVAYSQPVGPKLEAL